MTYKTLFLEDVYGENWQNEIGEDVRIEPRAPIVRGLGRERYRQLWQLFQREDHVDVLYHLGKGSNLQEAADESGLSQRQVINVVAEFLRMARFAFEQPQLLPPISFDEAFTPVPRVKSNRGRPPKSRGILQNIADSAQTVPPL